MILFISVLVLSISILTFLIVFIENKLLDKKRTKLDYFKVILMTNLVSLAVIRILFWIAPEGNLKAFQQIFGKIPEKITGGKTDYVQEIRESMFVGEPQF